MNTNQSIRNAVAYLLLLILNSCSTSTVQPEQSNILHTLTVGDSYLYHDHQTDLSGAAVAGSDTLLSAVVQATDILYAGRTGVARIIKSTDTLYMNPISDSACVVLQNPISIAAGALIPGTWVNFTQSDTGVVLDTTIHTAVSGMSARVHTTISTGYQGSQNITVGTISMKKYAFVKTVSVSVTIMGKDYTTLVTSTCDYVPLIGYFTSHDTRTESNSSFSPYPDGIQYSQLQSYSLK